jgi:biopolymer transport protein ExbD
MRRFSQRNSLVTLSDINITPLLDLAFVLLIIFIISTPLLEQGLSLKLPKGGAPDSQLTKNDIRTVEVRSEGNSAVFALGRRPMKLAQIEAELAKDYQYNKNLVVYVRADGMDRWRDVAAVFNSCQRVGISRFSARYEPETKH